MASQDRAIPAGPKTRKVLLIGNGPNRLTKRGISWRDMLVELRSHVGKTGSLRRDLLKPFPLLYEEIYLHGAQNKRIEESELKNIIARYTEKMEKNEVHDNIINLGVHHILTTNYDRALERAAGLGEDDDASNEGVVRERRYGLFRRFKLPRHMVWHIHGDHKQPETIMLGYEHYSGYLERMRSYVTSAPRYEKNSIAPLVKRLKSSDSRVYSWIDFFFQSKVYIVGLTLDFSEMHLWWLLTYRARMRADKKTRGLVRNSIFYIYPATAAKGERQKLELLEKTGVVNVAIPMSAGQWKQYYSDALSVVS
jgi:hypothetical protein